MDDIIAALKNIQGSGSFCTKRMIPLGSFNLEIKQFGQLALPLKPQDAKKLIKLAKPAKFGFREKTLLNKKIRDAWEISKSNIKLNNSHWHQELKSLLDLLKQDLGLAKTASLKASLHNLLIYEPGQFFNYHQDSEKLEGMVATLIIVLPSAHKGGTLTIDNHGNKKQFHSGLFPLDKLTCIAFYADCHHKITKLTEGYRCALTYNLTLENTTPAHDAYNQKADDKLIKSLRQYFSGTQNVTRSSQSQSPVKYVYLLDHAYTEKGLSWEHLKNSDVTRAKALKTAADALDLEICMALADVQETWDCEVDYDPYYYRRSRYNSYENEEEQNIKVTELIDSSTVLKHWIDRDNKSLNYKECFISNKELSWTTANNELEPFQSEYEGFMGNYGNTLDRWYHRAAIILWQKKDHYAVLFSMDPSAVFSELLKMIGKKSNEARVSQIIASLLPYWSEYIQHTQSEDSSTIFKLALYIKDPIIAKSMLTGFNLAVLTPERTHLFLELQETYGNSWCFTIIQAWAKSKNKWEENLRCKNIFAIIKKLSSHPNHQKLTSFLLNDQLKKIASETALDKKHDSRKILLEGISKRMKEIKDFTQACIIVDNYSVYFELLDHLIQHLDLYPAIELIDILDLLKENLEVDHLKKWHYQKLFDHVRHILENEKKQGLREANDWSIHEKPACKCEDCNSLIDFLKSKTANVLTWPLGKERRKHLHRVIDDLSIPISHQTEHVGSPHKLILKKTAKLHQEATRRFDSLKKALYRLVRLEKLRVVEICD